MQEGSIGLSSKKKMSEMKLKDLISSPVASGSWLHTCGRKKLIPMMEESGASLWGPKKNQLPFWDPWIFLLPNLCLQLQPGIIAGVSSHIPILLPHGSPYSLLKLGEGHSQGQVQIKKK